MQMIASRLERMDKQLHDMSKAVAALRNSNAPFYGTLRDWAVSQQAIQQRQQAQVCGPDGGESNCVGRCWGITRGSQVCRSSNSSCTCSSAGSVPCNPDCTVLCQGMR